MHRANTKPSSVMRSTRSGLAPWKKLLFGLITTLMVYVGVEMLLAALGVQTVQQERDPFVGFESSYPLFARESTGQGNVWRTATNKLRYFNPQQFPEAKLRDTFRIFCLGGSTTYGRPYDDSTSFVAWLREMLREADKSRRWEVINAGGISYASYRIANMMEELCAYQPDLFIIYTGHNEFLEERTYRDLQSHPGWWRSMTAMLYRTRTFSLAANLLSPEAPARKQTEGKWILPGEVDTILDHASGPEAYQRDEELREQILEHFRFNLVRCIKTARAAGAGVLLVKPACNLKDFSPFKSEHFANLDEQSEGRWIELFMSAVEQARAGQAEDALSLLEQAEQIDGGRADLHFEQGKQLFASGRLEEAESAFQTAVDQDVCPLRATSQIQQAVESVAVEQQVPLIDFASILTNDCRSRYGHGLAGNEYFVDHVHPTIEANRLLGLALVDGLIQLGLVSPNEMWREEVVDRATKRIEARIDPALQATALTNLAQVLSWAGKQEEAGPLAVEALQMRSKHDLPPDPECMFYAAVHLAWLGSPEQSVELLKQVIQLQPNNLQAHRRLGGLFYELEQYQDALTEFQACLRLDPGDLQSQQMIRLIQSNGSDQEE